MQAGRGQEPMSLLLIRELFEPPYMAGFSRNRLFWLYAAVISMIVFCDNPLHLAAQIFGIVLRGHPVVKAYLGHRSHKTGAHLLYRRGEY